MGATIQDTYTLYRLRTEMTFPRADNDLLMLAPSFNLSPVAPVLSALSEPGISIHINQSWINVGSIHVSHN